MSTLRDQVRQDAASLHRFVSSVSDKCEHLSGAVSYQESTERFLDYISRLATATKSYIQRTVNAPTAPLGGFLAFRDEVATLRSSWGFLHQLVKPVLEADTLRLPICLLDGLSRRFREIPGFPGTDFVFYHSTRPNYSNVKLAELKEQAEKISNIVGGPPFPRHLGLIGIPYSQSSSLFINCLIPHEMGHHVFGELKLAQKFRSKIEEELLSGSGTPLETEARGTLTEMMTFWAEELFCDVFAIRLVGFCFSLAFIELFDIATVLDEGGAFQKTRAGRQLIFHQYPPDLFRLKVQMEVLKDDGWWATLEREASDSQYVATLKAAAALKEGDFLYPKEHRSHLRATFTVIVPSVISELNKVAGKMSDGALQWKDQGELVERYLERAIVPSALIPVKGANPIVPSPVALLNASYRFYIRSLPKLLSRIEGKSRKRTRDCSDWAQRLEMWTAKAIEDVGLPNDWSRLPRLHKSNVAGPTPEEKGSRAVLSKEEIITRLRMAIDDEQSLVITPLLDVESFDEDSVDLRLVS